MFEVNTFALMNLSRLFGEQMKQAGHGHIVNLVSTAGLIASAKSSLYSATKFAGIGFSNALRLELMPYKRALKVFLGSLHASAELHLQKFF